MREGGALFSSRSWFDLAGEIERKVKSEVDTIPENRLLNTAPPDLQNYLVEKYRLDVPRIANEPQVARREISIPSKRYGSSEGPLAGTAIDVSIAFTGDPELLSVQPTQCAIIDLPVIVTPHSLEFSFAGPNLNAQRVRTAIEQMKNAIVSNLERMRGDELDLSRGIAGIVLAGTTHRRQRLLADQKLVEDLGYPLKTRSDAPPTYIAPEVRRKIVPTLPPASNAPYKPEPTLSMEHYEHILRVLQNTALVMERSPSAFTGMDESSLRMQFLVQLNGHYEGQATGETFNYSGKTDILIRDQGKKPFYRRVQILDGTDRVDRNHRPSAWIH